MSDSSATPSRLPLSLPVSVVLVLLILAGNIALIYAPRGSQPVAGKSDVSDPAKTPTVANKPPEPPVVTPPITPPVAQPPVTPPTPPVTPPTTPIAEQPPKEIIERGITLTLQAQAGGAVDIRSARVVSLFVPAGTAPSPFIAPGPFTATFEGNINKDVWDFIAFSAEGAGSLSLTIGDKTILEIAEGDLSGTKSKETKILKGANPFKLVYKSPANGDARLRLFWSAEEIPREPLSAAVFTHDIGPKEIRTANKIRRGRELAATLRCTKCHATDAKPETGLPELAIDAPDLREIGARLNHGWMASWLRDPKAMREHATMPKLVHGDGKSEADLDKEAASMAAFLATLGKGDDGDIANDELTRGKGGYLFGKFGCIACHSATDDKPAHINLDYVAAKFKPKALVAFLKEPNKHYKWINMPNFALSDEEATQLAAYLLQTKTKEVPHAITGGDADLGKVLMAGSGCANCHQLEGVFPIVGPKLAELGGDKRIKGCLATDDKARGRAPNFGLVGEDLSALRAFLNGDQKSLAQQNLPEFAERRIKNQNCIACHQRDGEMPVFSSMSGLLEELHANLPEGSIPEPSGEEGENGGAAAANPPPILTFTGDKLRPEWMAKFIAGQMPYRPRPWMDMRMPAFPATADLLAKGLSMSHGLPPTTPVPEELEGPNIEEGQTLIGMDGGFNCIQCHGLGSQPAVAVFEAPGINLGYVTQRLQKDYFHRWMMDPLRFEPTTRMPKFTQGNGTTPLTDIQGGQAREQFEAIWKLLQEVSKTGF